MRILKLTTIRQLFIMILATVLLTSCYKEKINEAPEIIDYTLNPQMPKAGDEVTITINTVDKDSDEVYYNWKNFEGSAISDNKSQSYTCKVPYKEGDFCYSLEISDRKAVVNHDICIDINGFLYEDFKTPEEIWKAESGTASFSDEQAIVSADGLTEGIFNFTLPEKIDPPYSVYMSVSLNEQSTALTSADKYGMFLDFFNLGNDTLAKALWFRIYPESNVKNWKVSLYKDVGSTGAWENLEETALGISNHVKTEANISNNIKIDVLEDNTLSVYIDDNLVYTSTILSNNFLTDGIPPKLILDKIGARTSAGTINIDNVYVTKKKNLTFDEIFN